jgi:manganese/zinc/iron transport system permease protein
MVLLQVHMLAIALITAITCALPGIFLVLRGVALMSDAISHAILCGIVLMFMIVHSLTSPLLMVGAVLAGIFTVVATELLIATNTLKKDAAISLVFPMLFSVAVILISTYLRNVHLDLDMVLLGELIYAPFCRLIIHTIDYGPRALWIMGSLLLINVLYVFFCYKELMITIFDPTYARVTGFHPTLFYYGLMIIVSLTCVGAFDVVGSIVVVALMVTPAATAFLLVHTISSMIYVTIVLASSAAIGGYWLAYIADVSIAGAITVFSGILFLIVLIYVINTQRSSVGFNNPGQNLIIKSICLHVSLHKDRKYTIESIAVDLSLTVIVVKRSIDYAIQHGLMTKINEYMYVTPKGYQYSKSIKLA